MKARKTQTCVTCFAQLHGRKDKEYCSDECKNEHHRLARALTQKIRNDIASNKMIVRNYVILLGLFRTNLKKVHVHRNHLLKHGFDPKSALKKRVLNGNIYFEIGEFVFRETKNGILEIYRTSKICQILFEEFVVKWTVEFPDSFEEEYGVDEHGITVFFKRLAFLEVHILTVTTLNPLTFREKRSTLDG